MDLLDPDTLRAGDQLPFHKGRDNAFAWSDIRRTVTIHHPPKDTEKRRLPPGEGMASSPHVMEILRGISGKAVSSELVAIVGPSGAGKTCFLDVLACRMTAGSVSGHCTFNGRKVSTTFMSAVSSYVTQEDTFHPTQTVLEAVVFQAQLRLDSRIPFSKKVHMARALVSTAGLASKEDRWVGGVLPGGITIRGMSGGEKRRLFLCCGTITQPTVLFADEPTSGLDSLAALMISRLLRSFSDRGMIVLTTIHQPRQDIWNLFDKVLVLAKGYQIFYGSPAEADTWFSNTLHLTRPPSTPASDFILDQVNIDFDKTGLYAGAMATDTFTTMDDLANASSLYAATYYSDGGSREYSAEQEEKEVDTVPIIVHAMHDHDEEGGEVDRTSLEAAANSLKPAIDHDMTMRTHPPSWLFQYWVLLKRNFYSYVRSLGNVVARLVVVATVAVVTGLVYLGLGRSREPDALRSIMGAIFFCLLVLCLLPYAAQSTFLFDRRFFQGEHASGLYTCSAYYLANMTLEGLFNAVNGLIFGTIAYWMVAFHDFVHPDDPVSCAVGFIGILVIMNLVANILFMTFASPNQEVGFVIAAAYTALSALGSGLYVTFPSIYAGVRFIQYFSMMKYPYQTILMIFFNDNPRTTVPPFGMPVSEVLVKLEFNTPSTIGANLAVSGAMYVMFNFLGYLCLRHLYKERR